MPAPVPFPVVKEPLYEKWRSIIRRCHSPIAKDYPRYGGRGIAVCERWRLSIHDFQADLLPTFRPRLTLDRIDNDGDYSPENCRWATQKEQQRNRGNNVLIDTPWGRINIADAAERSGINYYTVYSRRQNGRPLFGAKSRGIAEIKHIVDTPWGKASLAEIAEKTGISYHTLWERHQKGQDLLAPLTPRAERHRKRSVAV